MKNSFQAGGYREHRATWGSTGKRALVCRWQKGGFFRFEASGKTPPRVKPLAERKSDPPSRLCSPLLLRVLSQEGVGSWWAERKSTRRQPKALCEMSEDHIVLGFLPVAMIKYPDHSGLKEKWFARLTPSAQNPCCEEVKAAEAHGSLSRYTCSQEQRTLIPHMISCPHPNFLTLVQVKIPVCGFILWLKK